MITIDSYHRNFLDEMMNLYNRETVEQHFVSIMDADRFVQLVETKPYFDPEGLKVAYENGRMRGWVHACVAGGTESWQKSDAKHGRIVMLICDPRDLDVGRTLMEEATRWMEYKGTDESDAMSCENGYPFYRGIWMGGEPMGLTGMPHVQMAFAAAGYKLSAESVFMSREMREEIPERAVKDVTFAMSVMDMAHETMRESWIGFEPRIIDAMIGEERAGRLGYVVLPPCRKLGAACINIFMLSVAERFRRRGIGAALVERALSEGYRADARYATVGTQLWNLPAQAMYGQVGFAAECVMVGRRRQTPLAMKA